VERRRIVSKLFLDGGCCRWQLAAVLVRNGTVAPLRLTLTAALLKNTIVVLWRFSVLQPCNFGRRCIGSEIRHAVDKWFVLQTFDDDAYLLQIMNV